MWSLFRFRNTRNGAAWSAVYSFRGNLFVGFYLLNSRKYLQCLEIGVITLTASKHKQSDALVERKTIMTPFMTEDFLLDTEFARRLYHDYAKD